MAEAPSGSSSSTSSGSTSKASGYATEKWAGKTKYQCDDCPYDTFNEELIKQHVKQPTHQSS
jgi:hypothetical protein